MKFLCCLLIAITAQASPFLDLLGSSPGGVTIVHGSEGSSLKAAQLIAEALPSAKLEAAGVFDARHFNDTGQTHVIAVGRLWDNEALRGRDWLPTWWMDRDWYRQQYSFKLTPEELGLAYMPTTGFMVAGFGEWPANSGIGYVEVDRSHYFMEWMVRSRFESVVPEKHRRNWDVHTRWKKLKDVESPTYPDDFPMRLIVRVTGADGKGVVAAAKALVEGDMLNGAVLTDTSKPDERSQMFSLHGDRYATELPFSPPVEAGGYRYIGWLLPSAFQYDGFAFEAGVQPKQMYRLKYVPTTGITNFWTTPHRRASQFEIAIAEFANGDEATRIKQALLASLAKRESYQKGRVTDFHVVQEGHALFLESLPDSGGKEILQACVAAWRAR